MKYSNLFLAFCLAAAVPAGISAADAKAEAAAKAKAQAEAQAKAERIRKANQQFNEAVKQLREAYEKADPAKQAALLKAVFDCVIQPDGTQNLRNAEGAVMGILSRSKATEKERFLLYYPKFIAAAAGDYKAELINKYADTLAKNKWMKPEDVLKLRKSAAAVKDLTPMGQFKVCIALDDLKGADAAAEKALAAPDPDPKRPVDKMRLLSTIINAFKEKEVFGSDYANKYYQKKIAMAPDADAKASVITEYAAFLKKFCIIPDEEIGKLLESRCTLPGITPVGKAKAYVEDLKALKGDTEAFQTLYNKALAEFKAEPKARTVLYGCLHSRAGVRCIVPLLEAAICDKEADGWQFLGNYANLTERHGYYDIEGKLDLKTLENFMLKQQNIYLNELTPLHAAAIRADADHKAAKADSDAKTKLVKDAEQSVRQAGKDKDARAKAEILLKSAREVCAKANAVTSEKWKAQREAMTARENARKKFNAASLALVSFYRHTSVRYYDSANPFCLKKAVAALASMEKMTVPFNMAERLGYLVQMVDLAYQAKDYAQVRTLFAKLKQAADDYDAAEPNKHYANHHLGPARDAARFVGYAEYGEENYEAAVNVLKPFIENKQSRYRNGCLEPYCRSLIALGRNDEVLPLLDDMVNAAPGYMQSRYKQQVEEFKARVEREKTAK